MITARANSKLKRLITTTKSRASLVLLAAIALLYTLPSCHVIHSPGGTIGGVSGQRIRVRLDSALEAVKISCDSAVSLRNERYELLTFAGPCQLTINRSNSAWKINGSSQYCERLELRSTSPAHLLKVGKSRYRGNIVLLPAQKAVEDSKTSQSNTFEHFSVDNHLPLEQYLAGVLACELYPHWDMETFKALAVTSRTYALYEMTYGKLGDDFDVYDLASQVYGGADKETYRSIKAVTETKGLVLAWGIPGQEKIFKAYFSSTCGGRTTPVEAMAAMKPEPQPLRGGVICNDCKFAPKYSWPTLRLSKNEIYSALASRYEQISKLGSIARLTVTKKTDWGRPIWLEIVGPKGQKEKIRAEDFRLVMLQRGPKRAKQLYSMNCRIVDSGDYIEFRDGHGHGHGVGLCPYGAEGMARRGVKYHDILYHYFPGAQIMQLESFR